jgi:hypothetical protein
VAAPGSAVFQFNVDLVVGFSKAPNGQSPVNARAIMIRKAVLFGRLDE